MRLDQHGGVGGGSRLALRRHLSDQLARAFKIAKVEDAPARLGNGRQRGGELGIDPIVEVSISLNDKLFLVALRAGQMLPPSSEAWRDLRSRVAYLE